MMRSRWLWIQDPANAAEICRKLMVPLSPVNPETAAGIEELPNKIRDFGHLRLRTIRNMSWTWDKMPAHYLAGHFPASTT